MNRIAQLHLARLVPLCAVPNCADDHAPGLYAIEDDIGRAGDDQFADFRLGTGSAQVRMFA